jgi:L-asparaginase II
LHGFLERGKVAGKLGSIQLRSSNRALSGMTLTTGLLHATSTAAEPLLVEVTRGEMVESRHHVDVAVVDAAGGFILTAGAVHRPVYGRSAIKGLQALPLLETGAADRFNLGDVEIALACASHNGEAPQVEAVRQWLERAGLSFADLECGSHMPYHEASAVALVKADRQPTPGHNNCSGKHAGFLTTARHMNEPTRGYIDYEHPVQKRVTGALEAMCGTSLERAPKGIDGCGIPVIGISLAATALGMARLADPAKLPAERKAAAERIRAAVAAQPFMVAGTGRFCTDIMRRLGARAFLKTGAEGVFCAALPEAGLGIALKAEDGAGRAAEAAIGYLLEHLKIIGEDDRRALWPMLYPPIVNRSGRIVGAIRVAGKDAA